MKVKFLPDNVEHEISPDQSIMQLAHEKGIKIKSVCNGMPSCAECRIKVVDGEHNLFPPSVKELSLIGTGYYIDQRRLSCQLKCFGDVTVDLAEQEHKQHTDLQRRPQGNLRKDDSEVSHAVTGNLIEDQQEEFTSAVEEKKSGSNNRKRHQHGGKRRRNNRNRNKGNRQNRD